MNDARLPLLLLSVLLVPLGLHAQLRPGSSGTAQISGVVRLEGKPAPRGIMVLLDVAPTRDQAVAGSGEVERTTTDAAGRFQFTSLTDLGRGNTKLFAVTAHFPGYKDAFEVVDLTFSNHGYVNLDLHRDTSRGEGNIPPEGPGATFSVRQPDLEEAEEALDAGRKLLLEKHDPKASIEEFKKAVKLDPKSRVGFLFLGTAYIQIQSWQDAQSAFEKATQLEPTNAEAFLGLGTALNGKQDFSGAQKPLKRSLELNPDLALAHYELARGLWALGKWQEADPHVRRSIELNKNFPLSHVLMGNVYLRLRNAGSALAEFQEYLRLDPQGPQAAAVGEMVSRIQKALGQQ